MLTETLHSIITAARKVVSNWPAMLLLALVYALFLAALYVFLAVREASVAQIVVTFALAILAPLLFFVLQSMVAVQTEGQSVGLLLRKSLSSFWKVILISLPIIALGILVAYLLGKAQAHWGVGATQPDAEIARRLATGANASRAARPIDWKVALLSTVRYLTFGLILPLTAIHLWLATVNEGLGSAVKRLGTHLARAFAPQSVLIYLAGFLVFGVAPYFLLFKTTQTKHAWLELSLLVARLAIVFALTLFGWVITVRALAQLFENRVRAPANEAA